LSLALSAVYNQVAMPEQEPHVVEENEEALFTSFDKLGEFMGLQQQLLDCLGEFELDSERRRQVDTLLSKLKGIVRAPFFHTVLLVLRSFPAGRIPGTSLSCGSTLG
jgi:hypothetical protein